MKYARGACVTSSCSQTHDYLGYQTTSVCPTILYGHLNHREGHRQITHTAVWRLLSPARRRGTHCQNVYVSLPLVLLFLSVFSSHSSSQSTSVSSALEALAMVRYISLRFTLHYVYEI